MTPLVESARLRLIEEPLRVEHCFLQAPDCCHFLWEYRPGRPRSEHERLICELKRRPSELVRYSARRILKEKAIVCAAQALRRAAPRAWVEQASWCPVPPSAQFGDPDHDDRLCRVLAIAFHDYDLDLRLLLTQSRSTQADHRASRRLGFETLYSLTHVDPVALSRRALRSHLIVFDDLLTTGKHFKCAQQHLREVVGALPISACFLARRVLAPGRRGLFGDDAVER